jgi:NitT/TauT family transport system permease protein
MVAFFGLWELIQRLTNYPPDYIVPLPSAVLAFTVDKWAFLLGHLAVTLEEAAVGFIVGTLLAVGLAIASVYNQDIEQAVMPFALALRSIPLIAITPALIFLLGLGWQSKVAVAVLVCFFPTLVNMIVGLRSVDHRLLELMHVLNASWKDVLIRLRLPSSSPSFFAALKIAVPSSILGAAVAEWINASAGIGYLIIISVYEFNTVQLYSTMFLSTIVSALAYLAVVWLEGQLLPWRKYLPST